jgi:hypothetical protein
MRQSVIEDEATTGQAMPSRPSTWFVTMDPSEPNQAYRPRVSEYAAVVESYLREYATTGIGTMTMGDLRTRLKRPEMLNTAVGLLHIVAQVRVMKDPSTHRVREQEFAALVYSQLLLEIALIFEELLAPIVGATPAMTLGGMLPSYSAPAFHITSADCHLVRDECNRDLDAAATSLLDRGGLAGRTFAAQKRDALLLYGVRNASAHRLARSSVLARRFEDLASHLLFAVFYLFEQKYT